MLGRAGRQAREPGEHPARFLPLLFLAVIIRFATRPRWLRRRGGPLRMPLLA
jgi:hypothetical protein